MSTFFTEENPLVLHFKPVLRKLDDEDFFALCQANQDVRIERTTNGDLIIMPPTGGKTGTRNFHLTGKFSNWVEADGAGKGFDSSTGFTLPNGAKRSPDVAWVRRERWDTLTKKEQEQFPPLCPDFVVELRSRTDALASLKQKMEEYIENGAQLGWLIDPVKRKVYIYRPGMPVEQLDKPESISGAPLLPGFTLILGPLWQ